MGAVRLAEEFESDSEALKSVRGGEQFPLRGNAAENKMGVRVIGGEEAAGGLDGGVCGLDGDLRGGQIPPDENVQVFNLGERGGHVTLVVHG